MSLTIQHGLVRWEGERAVGSSKSRLRPLCQTSYPFNFVSESLAFNFFGMFMTILNSIVIAIDTDFATARVRRREGRGAGLVRAALALHSSVPRSAHVRRWTLGQV